jgi:hypothetical protein
MEFISQIHTKEYLLSHRETLFKLAENSAEFALSEMAADFDILSYCDLPSLSSIGDKTVAHVLAKHQAIWLNNPASQNKQILMLSDQHGCSVAHELAKFQSKWATSQLAFDIDILSLCKKSYNKEDNKEELSVEGTVAQQLAQSQSHWVKALGIEHKAILLSPSGSDCSCSLLRWIYDNSRLVLLSNDFILDEEIMMAPVTPDGYQLALMLTTDMLTTDIDGSEKGLFFSNSPLAQNNDFLKLSWKTGGGVAHQLASSKKSNWINTPAAKSIEILSLTTSNGATVAHRIVQRHKNDTPKFLWDRKYADICITHRLNKNKTLSHALAESCEDWCKNAPEAFTKEFLTKRYQKITRVNGPVHDISLAECMNGIPFQERVMRVIRLGAAFRISSMEPLTLNSARLSISCANEILESTEQLISEENNPLVKAKITLAAYSTFRHFLTAERQPKHEWIMEIEQSNRENVWEWYTQKMENAFIDQVSSAPWLIDKLELMNDIEMQPGEDLVIKLTSERSFSQIFDSATDGADVQPEQQTEFKSNLF